MSQDASFSQSLLTAPEAQTARLDTPVAEWDSTYEEDGDFASVADRLMDTIFADVERMLERGVDLSTPAEPEAEPQPAALEAVPDLQWMIQPAEMNGSTLVPLSPQPMSPRPSLLEQATTEEELADLAELMAQVHEETSAPARSPARSFDKLLLTLALTSLVAAGGFWLYFRDRLNTASVAVAPPSAEQVQQQQKQEFLEYVGRALDRIERDTKAKREATAVVEAPPSPAAPTVLERIYIPVFQTPPARVSLPNPLAASPSPAPAAPPRAASTPLASPAAVPNIAAASTIHVLIGVLELGDRSAALFEINGTPQRIQVGEAVGSSGWMLVSIANQEAIVRRNGEVRSIYVGQQF